MIFLSSLWSFGLFAAKLRNNSETANFFNRFSCLSHQKCQQVGAGRFALNPTNPLIPSFLRSSFQSVTISVDPMSKSPWQKKGESCRQCNFRLNFYSKQQ